VPRTDSRENTISPCYNKNNTIISSTIGKLKPHYKIQHNEWLRYQCITGYSKMYGRNNNNNYDNLYGAVMQPYSYKEASQTTKLGKPQ